MYQHFPKCFFSCMSRIFNDLHLSLQVWINWRGTICFFLYHQISVFTTPADVVTHKYTKVKLNFFFSNIWFSSFRILFEMLYMKTQRRKASHLSSVWSEFLVESWLKFSSNITLGRNESNVCGSTFSKISFLKIHMGTSTSRQPLFEH